MKFLTDEELEEIRQRHEKAINGPWTYEEGSFDDHKANIIQGNGSVIFISHVHSQDIRNTLPFVASSWEDTKNLLYTIGILMVQLDYERSNNKNNVSLSEYALHHLKTDITNLSWELVEEQKKRIALEEQIEHLKIELEQARVSQEEKDNYKNFISDDYIEVITT